MNEPQVTRFQQLVRRDDESITDVPLEYEAIPIEEEEPRFDPAKIWYFALKHCRLITAGLVLGASVAAYVTLRATPLYTAHTVVLVKSQTPDILSQKDAVGTPEQYSNDSETFLKTQLEILRSRMLAAEVIQRLNLTKDPAFLGTKPQSAVRSAGLRSQANKARSDPNKAQSDLKTPSTNGPVSSSTWSNIVVDPGLINRYLSMMTVSIEDGTSLITIAFSTPDPRLSSRLAAAHAETYAQMGIATHDQANEEAERFLQERLVELRKELQKSEIALNNYRRKHGIIPGLIELDGKQTVFVDRMRDINKELTDAELDRITLSSQVQLIKDKQYRALPAIQNNSAIQNLQSTLDADYAEIASLSPQFTDSYPPLAALEAKAAKTHRNLDDEVQKIVNTIQMAYNLAVAKEASLQAEMDKQKQQVLSLNDAIVEYAMLQREADTNRALTDNVLQKMKDVGLEKEYEASNVAIIDRPEIPSVPSSPQKMRNLIKGGMGGLVIAVLLGLGLEYKTNSVAGPEEAELLLRLPQLGIVPELGLASVDGVPRKWFSRAPATGIGKLAQNVAEFEPHSIVVDAYRGIRTALLLSKAGNPPKVALFTSAMRGEGKTLTAVNTAIMLSQLGARVLLIDGDLRRGRCHAIVGAELGRGLTECLIGVHEPEEVIVSSTITNLSVLRSGATRPPNSTELVGSSRMRDLLGRLTDNYEFVVIDAPPLIPVSDALLLSTMVDGVVLVIDSRHTSKKQIKAAHLRLQYARVRVFGFVLNRMHPHSFHYQYYYGDYRAAGLLSTTAMKAQPNGPISE